MKRHFLKLGLYTIVLALGSCASTRELEVTALEPAAIDLQQDMVRIGIVNSSESGSQDTFADGIDRRISKEDVILSEKGQDAAIIGLQEALDKDGRFDTIIFIKNTPQVLRGLGTAPKQEAWQSIAEICETHDLDAIFALASYETDTQVKVKKTSYIALDMIRVRNKVRGHEITVETLIENGWRIYEPSTQTVLDEFVFTGEIVSTGQGKTPARALENLGSRHDDFVVRSKEDGTKYGARLRPTERKIVREYYIKGSPNLEQAHRFASDQDWEQAVSLWEKDIQSTKSKTRSKACHNLAVWHEYQGRLEDALIWARKADETFSTKSSKAYVANLESRQERQILVNSQLSQLDFIK